MSRQAKKDFLTVLEDNRQKGETAAENAGSFWSRWDGTGGLSAADRTASESKFWQSLEGQRKSRPAAGQETAQASAAQAPEAGGNWADKLMGAAMQAARNRLGYVSGSSDTVNDAVTDYRVQRETYQNSRDNIRDAQQNVARWERERDQLIDENRWTAPGAKKAENQKEIERLNRLIAFAGTEAPERPLLDAREYANRTDPSGSAKNRKAQRTTELARSETAQQRAQRNEALLEQARSQELNGSPERGQRQRMMAQAGSIKSQMRQVRQEEEQIQKRYQPDSRDYQEGVARAEARYNELQKRYEEVPKTELPQGTAAQERQAAQEEWDAALEEIDRASQRLYAADDDEFDAAVAAYKEAEARVAAAEQRLRQAERAEKETPAEKSEEEQQVDALREKLLRLQQEQTGLDRGLGVTQEQKQQKAQEIAQTQEELRQAEAKVAQKEAEARLAERDATLNSYEEEYRHRPDFGQVAAETKEKSLNSEENNPKGIFSGFQKPGDRLGYYLANQETLQETLDAGADSESPYSRWHWLSDNEIDMYYYLLGTKGEEAAYQYLDDLTIRLDKRISDYTEDQQQINYATASTAGKVGMNLLTPVASVAGSISSGAVDAFGMVTGQYNPYSSAHGVMNYTTTVRGATAREIANSIEDPFWSQLAANSYQAVMSAADSALGATLFGNGYTAMMGSTAASQKARELYESGASNAQIGLGAVASGLIEVASEKYSIEYFTENFLRGDINGFKDWAKKTLIMSLNEGSEEVASEIANIMADAVIQGGNSDNSREIAEMMNAGMSYDEAKRQAFVNRATDVFWAYYGGALSGGTMGGIGGAINGVQQDRSNRAAGRQIIENQNGEALLQAADSSGTEGKLRAAAEAKAQVTVQQYQEMTAREQRETERAAGRLYSQVAEQQAQTTEQEIRQDFVQEAEKELAGKTENPAQAAEIVAKEAFGEKLTRQEQRIADAVDSTAVIEKVQNSQNFQETAGQRLRALEQTLALTDGAENPSSPAAMREARQTVETAAQEYEDPGQMTSLYKAGQDPAQYTTGWRAAYDNGSVGLDVRYSLNSRQTRGMTQEQILAAHEAGRKAAGYEQAEGNVQTSEKWNDVRRPGRQIAAVAEGTAAARTAGQEIRAGAGEAAAAQGKVSAWGLGIANGTTEENLTVRPAASYTADEKAAEKVAQAHGLDITIVQGGSIKTAQEVDGRKVLVKARALIEGNKIIVRSDDPTFTAEQIARHEAAHKQIEAGEINLGSAVKQLQQKYSPDQLREIIRLYAAAYGNSGMNARQVLEEIVCDAMGEMNAFATEETASVAGEVGRFLRDVNRAAQESTAENGQKKNAREGVRFSRDGEVQLYDYTKPFAEQIADWKAGKIPPNDTLMVGKTPDVFLQIGFNNLPVTMNQRHIDYALNGTKNQEHHIGEGMLKQLPQALRKPVAIIASETKKSQSVVALLPFTKNGSTVIAPVQIDGFGYQNSIQIDSNAVTSIYGRANALTKLLSNAIQKQNNGETAVFYLDTERAAALYSVARVTMPKMPSTRNGYVASITDAGSPVKLKIGNVTESQQFKRWFGDWQNHPEKASKVVNEDGTPKLVYHQTGESFTVFETRHAGAGTGDADTPFGIFLKSSDKDIGLRGNRQMALYADIKKPLVVQNREQLADKLSKISGEYARVRQERRTLNVEFEQKLQDAGKTLQEYVQQWQKENPGKSSIELYDDNRYNELSDAEDNITDEWGRKEREASRRSKEAITKDLEAAGYDGIIIRRDEGSFGRSTDAYIALHPEQVKSATDNIGTFDRSNPDIRYSQQFLDAAENKEIKALANKVIGGDFRGKERIYLKNISEKNAERIQQLTGINVDGFRVAIEARQIEHILKGHGIDGDTDHSMADIGNVAKIEYALDNPDSIVFAGSTRAYVSNQDGRNKPAKTVLYEKSIGEKAYYVVQAVADTKAKTLFIVSAYIGQQGYKKGAPQFTNAISPGATSKTAAVDTLGDTISQQEGKVKGNTQFSREMDTIAALKRQNEILQMRIDYWRSQTEVTKGALGADKMQVKALARKLLRDYGSRTRTAEIAPMLQQLADAMQQGKNEVKFESLKDMAENVARAVLEGSEIDVNADQKETAKELKRTLRNRYINVDEGIKEDIGDFADWKKRNRALHFKEDGKGVSADSLWLELQDEFGKGLFPESVTNPADQIRHIADTVARMQEELWQNPYSAEMELTVQQMANDILNEVQKIDRAKGTKADQAVRNKQKELDALEENVQMREAKAAAKADTALRNKQKELDALIERGKMREAIRTEEHQKAVYRQRIRNLNEKFQKMAVKPGKGVTQHAPRELVKATRDFCELFNDSEQRRADRWGKTLEQRADKLGRRMSTPNVTETMVEEYGKIESAQARMERMKARVSDLQAEYARMENGEETIAYDENVKGMIDRMAGTLRGKDIYQLSANDLQTVAETMSAMMYTVTNANKAFSLGKDKEIIDTAKKWADEMRQVGYQAPGLKALAGRYAMWQMTPDTFFNYTCGYIKDNEGQTIQKAFKRGEEKMLGVQREFYEMMQDITESGDAATRKELSKLMNGHGKKDMVSYGLKDSAGNDVATTRGMMMQVYMMLQQRASRESLQTGGFSIPNMDAYYKGDYRGAYGNAEESAMFTQAIGKSYGELAHQQQKNMDRMRDITALLQEGTADAETAEALQAEAKQLERDTRGIRAEMKEIVEAAEKRLVGIEENIEKTLTPLERQLIDRAHEWYSHTGDLMSEVYTQMYGFQPRLVEGYVPIHRDPASIKTDIRTMEDAGKAFNLENSGFTIERVRNSQPILLTDFFQELERQKEKMSRYVGFAQVQKDFGKIWKTRISRNGTTINKLVEAKFGAGKTAFGVSGVDYVEHYIADVAGGHSSDDVLGNLYGNYAAATLRLNPRVAVSQAASIPTAASVVGWKSMAVGFAKGLPKAVSKDYRNELAGKNVWFWQRYRGQGGSTELADIRQKGNVIEKVANSRVGKKLFNWCQTVDVFSTGSIMWSAAEDYVQTQRGLKPGAEGYEAAVNEVYTDIIRKSQPNYTTTERSDLLRDNRAHMKMLTMFKTQSNQNLNLLMEANGEFIRMRQDFKNGRNNVTAADVKAAKAKVANAATGVFLGGTVAFVGLRTIMNFIMAAVNPYRDKDTDEVTLAGVMKGMAKEVLSSLAGTVAIGGQVYDVIMATISGDTYYGLSDSAISVIAGTIENTQKVIANALDEGKEVTPAQIWKAVNSWCTAWGIPAGNAKKVYDMVLTYVRDVQNGTFGKYTSDKTTAAQYRAQVKKYVLSGNADEADNALAMLFAKSGGDTDAEVEKDIAAGMRTYLKREYMAANVTDLEAVKIMEYAGTEDAEAVLAKWSFMIEHPEIETTKVSDSLVAAYNDRGTIDEDVFLSAWEFAKAATADKDKNGKTISGSKKKKVVEYIKGLNLTNAQKKKLYELLDVGSTKDTPWG